MGTIRVLIVDDHPVYAQGLEVLLGSQPDLEVVGISEDGSDITVLVAELEPDVVVLDVQLPGRNGSEVAQEIKLSAPGVHILGLSGFGDDESIYAMIAAGVSGYLLKEASPEEIARAIRLVAAGESYLTPSVTRKVIERFSHLDGSAGHLAGSDQLSQREIEILSLIVQGESNKEIGRRLYVSTRTVENHIYNIYRKIGVNDRTQAMLYAIRHGLVEVPVRVDGA